MSRELDVDRVDVVEGARRRPAVLVEVVILAMALGTFFFLHAAAESDAATALAHARALESIERALGLDIELATNEWLVSRGTVAEAVAVVIYRSYYLVILGVLAWVYLRHTEVYLQVRRTFVAMLLLVLPVYVAVPMSPPRFALPGVVDVVAAHSPIGAHSAERGDGGVHVYSAMPSLHVALAMWCAYAVWRALRRSHPRWALAAWLYPVLMTAVVFTTGNHYVLDVVGSAVLLLASIGVASLWGRLGAARAS